MKRILFCCILFNLFYNEVVSQSNYTVTYPAYNWETPTFADVSTSNADDASFQLYLPFTFSYFGTCYSSCYVSTNGLMTFGSGSAEWINSCLPNSSAPNFLIAGYWDDLYSDVFG